MIPGLRLGFGSLFPVGMAGKLKEMVAQGNAAVTASKHPSGRMKMSRKNDHGRTARDVFAPLTDKHTPEVKGNATGRFRETFPALQNFPIKAPKTYTAEEAAAMAEVVNRIAESFCGRSGISFIPGQSGHIAGGLEPSRVPAVDTERGYLLHGPLAQIGRPRSGQLSSPTPNFILRPRGQGKTYFRTFDGRVPFAGDPPASIDFGLSGPGDEYGLEGAPVISSPVQRWAKRTEQGESIFPPCTTAQGDGRETTTAPGQRCSGADPLETGTYPADAVGPIDRGESYSRLGEVEVAEPEDRLLDSHAGGALFDHSPTADHDTSDTHDW